MKLPDELNFMPDQILFGKGSVEAIVRDCAKVCKKMYDDPPEDWRYDLKQGWEAALDLAEQAILKRYGLD